MSADTERAAMGDLTSMLDCLSEHSPRLRAALLGQSAGALEPIELAAGGRLLTKGETASAVYVVYRGQLHATATRDDGGDLVLSTFGEGRVAGELAVITGAGIYSANVTAVEDSRLVRIPRAIFERIIHDHPEVLEELSTSVSQRVARDELASGLTRLFGPLSQAVLQFVESRVEWIRLHAGDTLFSEGDTRRDLYFILGGRLRAMAGSGRVLSEMSRGESIGEIALLTGEPRTATVVAVRDCQLVRISPTAFEEIVQKYPRVMQVLAGIVVKRLRARERSTPAPRSGMCVAVLTLGSSQAHSDAIQRLVRALTAIGPTLHLTSHNVDRLLNRSGIAQAHRDDVAGARLTAWLEEQESGFRFLVYQPDTENSEWTRRCLRQADDIVLIAHSAADPRLVDLEKVLLHPDASVSRARQTLVLLHPDGQSLPTRTTAWLNERPELQRHFHVRLDQDEDFARVARCLAGVAVGVVFGGGGARGLAHIGVIRALREVGVPIDMIGGTSMGAVIAGALGMGHSWDDILEISRNGWLKHKPHKEYTLPFISLIRTRVLDRWAREVYGEADIEDLWLNFFCVSCNLTKSEMVILDRGRLWQAVRASSSLPGVFVPVLRDGSVFVDGAIVNNLPGDIMRKRSCQNVIVIDVGSETTFDFDLEAFPTPWQYLWNSLLPFRTRLDAPNIAAVLMRTTEVSSVQKTHEVKRDADLCLRPPIDKYGVLDFESIDQIVEAGYEYALRTLNELKSTPAFMRFST